jgi:hypothetical protein
LTAERIDLALKLSDSVTHSPAIGLKLCLTGPPTADPTC